MKYFDEIEAYLNKTLSQEDRISFEQDCQTNETLAKELAFYLEAKQAAKEEQQAVLQQRYYKNKAKDRNVKLMVGIIGILIILLGIWFFSQREAVPPTFAALAEQQTPIDFLISETTLSGTATTEEVIEKAIKTAKTNNFEAAIQMLDTLSSDAINYYKVLKIRGWSHFNLGHYEEAIISFEGYLQQDNGGNRSAIRWNKALAHLALGEAEAAKTLLNVLINSNAPNKEVAITLLEQIGRVRESESKN